MSDDKPKRFQRSYTLEDIDRGLVAYILAGNNSRQASKNLAEMGHDIPHATINNWATFQRVERFEELQTELAPRIAEKIANEAEAFIVDSSRIKRKLLKKLEDDLDTLDAKDLAAAIRNQATSEALALDKIASPLRGRPSRIVATPDMDQLLGGIRRLVGADTINSTAHEITDGEDTDAKRVSTAD